MKTRFKNKGTALKNQSGFTLIEMLIVVIVLGILAMIIIPQISVSTEDAKLKTLQTNLNTMRNAIELYYHQHNQKYPGATKTLDGSATSTDAEALSAFTLQLTTYTDVNGQNNTAKTGAFIYGPYIKMLTLPMNPYSETDTIFCEWDETDITARLADTSTAWRFYVKTGVFIANDHVDHDDY